ncbi:glutathione S-transferase kappa 1 [Paragonimus westermani]|uniref:Glutathione S-transferase kappa 1 n=1 Tax=Paragonimus westermani TaxID=34504 RepID=A0A5J4NSK7_9TREM|nr:glutathione S-transferase kappa 1 [Paragonimus westermani]
MYPTLQATLDRKERNTFTAVLEKGSLEAQRLLTAIAMSSMAWVDSSNSVFSSPPGGLLETVARRLWLRIWSAGEDITTNDNLRTVLQDCLTNVDQIDRLLVEKGSTSVKKALRRNTEPLGCRFSTLNVMANPAWSSDQIDCPSLLTSLVRTRLFGGSNLSLRHCSAEGMPAMYSCIGYGSSS